jgi:hypothetical protein
MLMTNSLGSNSMPFKISTAQGDSKVCLNNLIINRLYGDIMVSFLYEAGMKSPGPLLANYGMFLDMNIHNKYLLHTERHQN